jgi:thiol-disulfide isomerase/thioredoxin
MKLPFKIAMTLLAFGAFTAVGQAAENTAAAKAPAAGPTLKMGDDAPEFKATEWHKGGPIKVEADKTYIVECWATWCGPCIAAFPHLSELAKANEGKITVIGMNVWEKKKPEEVKAFVEAQGDKMSYNVAADGDGYIADKWLKAAGRNGIPCAFVVNKGKIAWIGHPATLDQKLLTSVVDGTFDVAAAAQAEAKKAAPANYFKEHVMPLMAKKDIAGAVEQLEAMKKEFPDEAKTIDTHITRLKAQIEKEAAAK